MEPEFWPGDCGDLIDSLWYLNIDRAIQQGIDLTLDTLRLYGFGGPKIEPAVYNIRAGLDPRENLIAGLKYAQARKIAAGLARG